MRHSKSVFLGLALIGALSLVAGCGGGAGGGAGSFSGDGSVSVLLTDAPLLVVNGRSFSQLNVTITAFEASVPGTRTFTSIPLTTISATPTSLNLLDLNNDQEWLAVASLPAGYYDRFRLTVETATANLVEDGTNAVVPLVVRDPNGELTFVMAPPLHVEASQPNLLIVDWLANRSVHFDPASGDYVLSGVFLARAVNRHDAPVPFRALPALLTSVNTSSGDMRIRLERHSAARYLVRTANALLLDHQGQTLQISKFQAGDFVIISGTIDGNADIDATHVRKLPSPAYQPPPPGTPGPGPGLHVVFAHGVIQGLDTTKDAFVLRTAFHGPVAVVYDDGATRIGDARQRPPQPATEAALADGLHVDVVGVLVPPAAPGAGPSIDATRANGAPGGILITR